jgi:hypothetical protein
MKAKLMIILFLFFWSFVPAAHAAHATHLSNIEIFDVKNERVIKLVANSKEIQGEIQQCLKAVKGITKRLIPITKDSKIIKIPIQPSIMVNNQWMNTLIDEVKLILPTNAPPLLMLFDDENRPYFFEFDYDVRTLLAKMEK